MLTSDGNHNGRKELLDSSRLIINLGQDLIDEQHNDQSQERVECSKNA